MTPREILIAARAKIEAPERWTKGESARDSNGFGVRSRDPSALCWCVIGAIKATGGYKTGQYAARESLETATDSWDITTWNDAPERTHAEVLAAFDRAIELAGDA